VAERIRVAITGATGRMGAILVATVRSSADFLFTGATERPDSPALGRDAGLVVGTGPSGVTLTADFDAALSKAEVVIDFTSPSASVAHAAQCASRHVPLVIGSTGLSPADRAAVANASRSIPIVVAPNMSVGVNLLFSLVSEVSRTLGESYDVEIVETHHRLKKDAPSGTAVRLAEIAAEALGIDASKDVVRSRDGQIGERPRRSVGVQTLRGGDVVGDHTVLFLGDGERLELTHRATSRTNFAQGALRAGRWIIRQQPGLYDMQDVLGLRPARSST
jgi:4-hydroxy-tetrahydrodipicolinate reductase